MANEPTYHVFGIRHHGPGSARSVLRALEELQPDMVLVEGPPDAHEVLPLLAHAQMQPPVALLIYVPEEPQRAVYYPFATFSPEWQALRYALTHGIPARFMDLPQTHQLAMRPVEEDAPPEDEAAGAVPATGDEASGQPAGAPPPPGEGASTAAGAALQSEPSDPSDRSEAAPAPGEEAPNPAAPPQEEELPPVQLDPLRWLAEAAGYGDGERWWEHMVEERRDCADLFAGILEAMAALRAEAPPTPDPIEVEREAFMRQSIRAAQAEGFQRIAVVCGAWHAPALAEMPPASHDARQLKGLPKVKVQATWVPWTYGRLSYHSGYGAGIESPGWYQHLWTYPSTTSIRWLTRVAHLLREQDLDASSAHIIEAVRLSDSLAALRDRPQPGLPELNEATQTVFCFGSDLPMHLIYEKLIIGDTLGKVPEETPMVPLQQDLLREQKRLRLPAEAAHRDLDLDLRKPNELDRSRLLHRLNLLGVPWGQIRDITSSTSTFHEFWRIQWQPELAVALIEAGVWGNTLLDAATACARDAADHAPDLASLTGLLNRALLADLPDAVAHLMARLQEEAALASDVGGLMDALPPLANVTRYGNVRQTIAGMVAGVVDGLVARICIGLPGACASLNDEAAAAMYERLLHVNGAVALLRNEEHLSEWQRTLRHLADMGGLHGLIAGRCCRILLDAGGFAADDAARRLGLALSTASEPAAAAAWVEGFLKGSGLVLLHDEGLWKVLDGWIAELPADTFPMLLPLLRRTFSTFPAPERRQMGERARKGPAGPASESAPAGDLDAARAEAVLPLLARILGVDAPAPTA